MNQHIKTSLGVIIILIIAVTVGVFVWKAEKNNPIETGMQTVTVKPVKNQEIANNQNRLTKIKSDSRFNYYEGSIRVSGKYSEFLNGMLDETLCFYADNETAYLIPRENGDRRSPWFCFNDQKNTKTKFGISEKPIKNCQDEVGGNATIVVNNYKVDKLESEVTDTSDLVEIIKKDASACLDSAGLQMYWNKEYGFSIQLPTEWKSYSEYDGKILANSPDKFDSNPTILTGTPPKLDFQISLIENQNVNSYVVSFLNNSNKTGELKIKSGETGYKFEGEKDSSFIIQVNRNLLKIYSSDKKYSLNDKIFSSIEINKK